MKGDKGYFIRPNGQKVATVTAYDPLDDEKFRSKRRRKPFKANWVKYPTAWSEKLRGSSGAAHDLAHAIMTEAFKRAYVGGEVKLSAVNMPRKRELRWLRNWSSFV
jgi:hypothetical protein